MNAIPVDAGFSKEKIDGDEILSGPRCRKNDDAMCKKVNAVPPLYCRAMLMVAIATGESATTEGDCIIPLDAEGGKLIYGRRLKLPKVVKLGEYAFEHNSRTLTTMSFNNLIVRATGHKVQIKYDHVSRIQGCSNDSCVNPRHLLITISTEGGGNQSVTFPYELDSVEEAFIDSVIQARQ
jgi:hypothetical protein